MLPENLRYWPSTIPGTRDHQTPVIVSTTRNLDPGHSLFKYLPSEMLQSCEEAPWSGIHLAAKV